MSGMGVRGLGEILRLAWGSLLAHRLRGGLTILGIVIGITSVVAMVSLVEGLNRSVADQIAGLGSDVIRIRRFDPGVVVGELPDSLRNRRRFEPRDAGMVGRIGQLPAIWLLEKVAERFSVTDFQPLREFDGQRGYSLAQGQ